MAKNRSNIRTQVRSYLDEPTATDWTEAELNTLVNVYYHQVYAAAVEVYEDYKVSTSNITTIADQQEYSLPTDLFKIRRVEVNYDVSNANSIPLRALPVPMDSVRRDLGNQNLGVTIQRSPVYFLRGTVIGFIPVPDKAGTNAIKIWYVPTLSDLSDDTTNIDIPYADRYWLLIAYGAAAEALRFGQQESVEAGKLEDKFFAGIEKMKQELEDRIAEEGKTVVDTSGENIDFASAYSGWS